MENKSEVFALKYRPQTFKDLIGHEEISTTIYNSLENNKSPNAYLFTGIRGIGKTTFARIVAKALNCENGVKNLCSENFCNNCKSIINSSHIDVLEIDAASRTGVDDIRELIEFSRYGPSISKYKIFIIDEVHMLSKQAFNALLKTLEEPPAYLKFIFATTEIKKIPITVISRCQRFDLSRVSSQQLFDYLKNIIKKEKRKIEDKALKLIVKISEGSVRDSLSLLDRALLSNNKSQLTFENTQKIFGYVDKSSYIDLLEFILAGKEQKAIDHYKTIYTSGVEPISFLNEFLEILYFVKNISFISADGASFTLNDNEHKKILALSKQINASHILLFWEFTLKTIKEISIVSNQNLAIEMFIIQLIYLSNKSTLNSSEIGMDLKNNTKIEKTSSINKVSVVEQIKNIEQLDDSIKTKKNNDFTDIKNFDDIIKICTEKKEIQLKYELENNVNLVSFNNCRIEISFNLKLNKNFVKDLSLKLLKWTGKRWIISFSNDKGQISKKDLAKNISENTVNDFKKKSLYTDLLKSLPDIELIDIIKKND